MIILFTIIHIITFFLLIKTICIVLGEGIKKMGNIRNKI